MESLQYLVPVLRTSLQMPFCIVCGVQVFGQDSKILLTLPGSCELHLYCRKLNKLGAFSFMLTKSWSTRWRFPAPLSNLRQKIFLGAYSLVMLLQKRMNGTPPTVLHPPGATHFPARKRGLFPCVESVPTPESQEMRLPCLTPSTDLDPKVLGTAGPQHPLSTMAHVHGGHAWQGPICWGDNSLSSTGQHTACPNSAVTNSWEKGGCRWENNSPPGERWSACRHLKALPDCPALGTQGHLLTLGLASKLLRLKSQKFGKNACSQMFWKDS